MVRRHRSAAPGEGEGAGAVRGCTTWRYEGPGAATPYPTAAGRIQDAIRPWTRGACRCLLILHGILSRRLPIPKRGCWPEECPYRLGSERRRAETLPAPFESLTPPT